MKTATKTISGHLPTYKRILILPFILALLCVVSCSKNEDVVDIDDLIVGTWQLTDYTLVSNVPTDDGTLNIAANGEEDMGDLLITFHPDGTTSYSGVGFTLAYTVSKDDITLAEEEMRMQSMVLNGTWKKEGDKLIVDYPGYGLDPLEIQIELLTENELQLAATVEPLMALPESGYTAVTASVDAHFVRTTLPVQRPEIEEVFTDPIVGTWRLEYFGWNTVIDPVDPEDPTLWITYESQNADESDVEITFNLDGTTTYNGNSFTAVMTMEVDGVTASEQEYQAQPGVVTGGTWKRVDGNTLIVDHPSNPFGPIEMHIDYLWREVPGNNEERVPLYMWARMPPPIPIPGLGEIQVDIEYYRVY